MLSIARGHVGRRLALPLPFRNPACPSGWTRRPTPHCVASARSHSNEAGNYFQFSSTSSPAAAILASRRATQLQVPAQQFAIVGVSFENRQDAVKQLQPGQGLLFLHEPHNPHDPNAVAVHSTGGAPLGYVPRDLTHHFPHERVPGHVRNVTTNSSGLHGARVLVRPTLPGLLLQHLPAALWARGCAELEPLLGPAEFARLQQRTHAAAGHRCEVTGVAAGPSVQLKVSPVWRLDAERRVAVLVRCMAVCGAVYDAERLLDPAQGPLVLPGALGGVPGVDSGVAVPEAVQRTAELLQDINFWRMQDIWEYLQHCQAAQQQLSTGGADWQHQLAV